MYHLPCKTCSSGAQRWAEWAVFGGGVLRKQALVHIGYKDGGCQSIFGSERRDMFSKAVGLGCKSGFLFLPDRTFLEFPFFVEICDTVRFPERDSVACGKCEVEFVSCVCDERVRRSLGRDV
jgi:hypothetical protein